MCVFVTREGAESNFYDFFALCRLAVIRELIYTEEGGLLRLYCCSWW